MNLNPFSNNNDHQQQTAGNENRTTLVASIVDLKSERGRLLEPLNHDYGQAVIAVEDAQKTLVLAQAKQHTADSKLRQATASYSHQISRIEKELFASAPTSINEFIEQIKNEQRELSQRAPLAHVTGVNQKAKERSEARNLRIQDTTDRLELMRSSIVKAEALRLSSGDVITTGLQTIRESLDLSPVTQ